MKGIILAAGRGSRLGSLTDENPKCMVSLLEKPLIEWQIQSLEAAGVSEISLVCGYKAEKLKKYSKSVYENIRWAETNMVRSLECADEVLRQNICIISYSDIVYNPTIVRKLINSKFDISITYDTDWYRLWSERFEDPLNDAETFSADGYGRLEQIGKKAQSIEEIRGQFMGLIKITPSGWNNISKLLSTFSSEKIDKLDMTSLLSALLEKKIEIGAVGISGDWCEIDNESDLRLYTKKILESQILESDIVEWHHDWRIKAKKNSGSVIWLTGLSGVGKSSIANELKHLISDRGINAVIVDGDKVREVINDSSTGHDRESRFQNAMRICRLAKMLSEQGAIVIVATMSLFKEVHKWNRENLINYYEVFIRASIESLKERDARGLYSRAADGKVKDVVGVHLEYDEPENAHLVIDNDGEDRSQIDKLSREILGRINLSNYLHFN